MASSYDNVLLASLSENAEIKREHDKHVKVDIFTDKVKCQVQILDGDSKLVSIPITHKVEAARVGDTGVVVYSGTKTYMLKFSTDSDMKSFQQKLKDAVSEKQASIFDDRTDPASAEQYFQFYGYLSQQQNMMQDYIRTSTYQRAMLDNTADFEGKVVMDVGAGSGILSFFAVQAGARKVYAIEASDMALQCEKLVTGNKLSGKIVVIPGKIEEVEIPEQVDIIISEPMGYMLFNERMLETYLHAKKWLKPGGKMFPTQGDLHITPFTDDSLYMEQFSKANFWYQPSFHGVDLSCLRQAAVLEYFKQPIVDTFDILSCLAVSNKHTVNFLAAHETDLHNMEMPIVFNVKRSGMVHGLAFWFDVAFIGSQSTVWLSTAPTQPLTHWYQVRCLLQDPIFVKQGQTLAGKVVLRANKRQSYDVDIELMIPGTGTKSKNTLDLKNPFFRYTGQQPQPPCGTNSTSPTETYWTNTDPNVQMQTGNGYMMNGGLTNEQLAQHQAGVVQQNLVQLGNVAPVNPGSIPAVGVNSPVSAPMQTRTSVGGGLSPAAFQQTSSGSSANYGLSNQYMIGDYMIPGGMVLPTQGLPPQGINMTTNNYSKGGAGNV